MSLIIEREIQIGDYKFSITINPANVVAQMQRDVFYSTEGTDETFVRSFFFDDILPKTVNQFCERFAHDGGFRSATLQRTSDWAIANDLFLRNCFNPYFQRNPFLEKIGSVVRAYTFFKNHAMQIIDLLQYQRIYQQDNAIQLHPHQPDPALTDAVHMFNQIEGVKTLASCQGVSGTVAYRNCEIMTLSPHARFAYIWFDTLPAVIARKLSTIPLVHTHFSADIYPMLVSNGDNSAYIDEILILGNKLSK